MTTLESSSPLLQTQLRLLTGSPDYLQDYWSVITVTGSGKLDLRLTSGDADYLPG